MHVTLQTLSVNPAKVHERFCPVHGFRHQPRTWRCDPATSSEGAGRFPLQRWFVLVDFLPAVWGRCTRARFSNSAPPRPLWSANISSQVTRTPSPVDIRDVTRRGLASKRRGNQTGVDVETWRPRHRPGPFRPSTNSRGRDLGLGISDPKAENEHYHSMAEELKSDSVTTRFGVDPDVLRLGLVSFLTVVLGVAAHAFESQQHIGAGIAGLALGYVDGCR